jgi:hypothetical protein
VNPGRASVAEMHEIPLHRQPRRRPTQPQLTFATGKRELRLERSVALGKDD